MEETLRIVLLGKTGSGKSRLGNTILGVKEDVFEVNHSPIAGTKTCKAVTGQVNGRNIKLIDTPGVFDTDPESKELSPELLKCIEECAPGPHAFLLVLKVEKYTKQEQAVVDVILKYFSEEALEYTTVVFNHGDDLLDETRIEDWVTENTDLNELIKKCGGCCHVFDNKYWNNSQDKYRNNKVQIENLLNTIEKTVNKNGGRYYTNDLLQKVATDASFLVKLTGVSTGVLLGALLGVPVMLLLVVKYTKHYAIVVKAVMGSVASASSLVGVANAVVDAGTAVGGGAVAGSGAVMSTAGVVGGGAVVGDAVVGGAAVSGAAVGAAVGAGIIAGTAVVGGAIMGGVKGYKVAKQAETPEEAAKAVVQEVQDFLTDIKNSILPPSTNEYQKLM